MDKLHINNMYQLNMMHIPRTILPRISIKLFWVCLVPACGLVTKNWFTMNDNYVTLYVSAQAPGPSLDLLIQIPKNFHVSSIAQLFKSKTLTLVLIS